jgi:uncharacterized protein (DUF2235 family)
MALFAFDGSWRNSAADAQSEWTNVRLFADLLYAEPGYNKWYWDGVGTRRGKVGKYVGGATGFGTENRLYEALALTHEAWAGGDRVIDIIGFSRGAATAAAFSWALHRWGVREPQAGASGSPDLSYRRWKLVAASPPIRFVGLFDTVFATEDLLNTMPFMEYQRAKGRIEGAWTHRLFGRDFRLPDNVGAAFQALAMHERRVPFMPTRIGNAYEVWFPGVHGDIGGGGKDRRVTNTTLRWMVRKARSVGIQVGSPEFLAIAEAILPDEVSSDDQRLTRTIRNGDRVHASAMHLPAPFEHAAVVVEEDG